jgi:cell division initiation protein
VTITPVDIQNKEFERSFRGYDIEDVDEFLDRIASDLEQLIRENMELKEQVSNLMEKNKNYQKLEETMHNAIVVAQETAEEVKLTAKREADLIRREAENEAKHIVDDARYRSGKILNEREDLFKQVQVFKMRFRSFIEAQLASLESEDWLDAHREEKRAGDVRTNFDTPPDFEPKADPEPLGEFMPRKDLETATDFEPDPDLKSLYEDDPDTDPEI